MVISRGIRSRSEVSSRREGRFEATGISRHATIPRDHRAKREVKVYLSEVYPSFLPFFFFFLASYE